MKIKLTAGEINEHGDWEAFNALKGIGYWAMAGGQLDSSEEFEFTSEEIKKIGMSGYLRKKFGLEYY